MLRSLGCSFSIASPFQLSSSIYESMLAFIVGVIRCLFLLLLQPFSSLGGISSFRLEVNSGREIWINCFFFFEITKWICKIVVFELTRKKSQETRKKEKTMRVVSSLLELNKLNWIKIFRFVHLIFGIFFLPFRFIFSSFH